MTTQNNKSEERALVLAPMGRDAGLTCKFLAEEGISGFACRDMNELCREFLSGAGAAILTEEALSANDLQCLLLTLEQQPLWSDLPLILFVSDKESARFFLETTGPILNLTILERPINIAIFVSTMRSALRARRRQYQMRDLLSEMKRANRMKDEFLATVSHELRTPLNAIFGWAAILRRSKLDKASVRAVETIERNARAQAQLIEDLLDMSRIISGNLRLDVNSAELISVINAAIDSVHPAAAAKQIQLQMILDPAASRIQGDASRLQQVVWNLLSNAVKFTPQGGLVQIILECSESNAQITVNDSGEGIDPEFLPYVFDPFQQADGTTTRRHGGLGLGLAIVRHIVEMHGGTIKAHSAGVGQGAGFTVNLPLAAAAAKELLPTPLSESASEEGTPVANCSTNLKGLRILAVDDEPDIRDMLKTALELCGADVMTAASAGEAFEALPRLKFDMLVCDIGMPGEDGYSLIRKIRALEPEQGGTVPAIALTGYVRVEEQIRALEAGYQMFVPKPVETDELASMIAKLIGQTDTGSGLRQSSII